MKLLAPLEAARGAVTLNAEKPATAILLETPDVRIVVFRLKPGHVVPSHRSTSTVMLSVLAGTGVLSGEENGAPCERACTAGDVIAYAPDELHAMRATNHELLLLATITPRPGSR